MLKSAEVIGGAGVDTGWVHDSMYVHRPLLRCATSVCVERACQSASKKASPLYSSLIDMTNSNPPPEIPMPREALLDCSVPADTSRTCMCIHMSLAFGCRAVSKTRTKRDRTGKRAEKPCTARPKRPNMSSTRGHILPCQHNVFLLTCLPFQRQQCSVKRRIAAENEAANRETRAKTTTQQQQQQCLRQKGT